jgi:surface polysaccharide O-acyltransferase-like enzyme
MQNLVNEVPAKKNYDFIDTIRGIAMISIVAEHSVSAGGYEFAYGSDKYWINIILIQLTKFGTIAFFLLAGFLIGEKFADYSPANTLDGASLPHLAPGFSGHLFICWLC